MFMVSSLPANPAVAQSVLKWHRPLVGWVNSNSPFFQEERPAMSDKETIFRKARSALAARPQPFTGETAGRHANPVSGRR
jgi:hypothetical protein